jgi:ribonuclease G
MSKELIVSTTSHETRVAVLEDDQVVEVFFQRENEYSLAGSIHKGRVTRVLPGMQSAFVDIGLERDAFLYVSDFFEDNEEYEKVVSSVEDQALKLNKGGAAPMPAATMPAPAAVTPAEVVAAAAPVDAPAVQAPRRDDQDRDRDRDRRGGRRSRRRRPNRGRGLPESKFYNPAQREPEAHTAAPAPDAEAAAPAQPPSEEDLLILPGESLAKYRGDGEPAEAEEPESCEPEVEAEAEAEPEAEAEVAVEPEAEEEEAETVTAAPVPALAQVLAETPAETTVAEALAPTSEPVETASEPVAEATAAPHAYEAEPVDSIGVVVFEEEVSAEEESVTPADVEPEPLQESAAESEVLEGETAEAVATEEAEAAGTESEQPTAAAEEGPEPARIPTSLTATLREQGPRYMHRISRRMRRKGGRGPIEERRSEQQRHEAPVTEPPQHQPQPQQQRTASRPERQERPAAPSITDLLREGQEIIVQIAKEPLGQKGARITSHIALPGRFLVYMPTVDHIGVSRKIASDEERARLKRVLQTHRTGIPGGYIVRTAGEGRSEEELRADMMFLYNLWLDLRQKAEKKPAPALIHHDLDVVQRVLRDQLTPAFKSVWVDNEEVYENVVRFVQRFQPAMVNRVKLYTRSNPIFDEFNVTAELEKALRPKVWLKSGGYIVINQTEALVAIDINTGKFVGKSNRLEDTIVKTNTDAVKEIVRQIRLRDLGGIIVVDFIDMDERKNRQKVMQALEEAMRADRAPYKILQFNDFGLVAITRKRVKQSLERTLCSPCPYCEAAGYVKSVGTVIGEIVQEAHKIARAVEGNDVMLRVNPEVAKVLKSNQNSFLQELEEILGRTVIVKSDPVLHQEKFDLA